MDQGFCARRARISDTNLSGGALSRRSLDTPRSSCWQRPWRRPLPGRAQANSRLAGNTGSSKRRGRIRPSLPLCASRRARIPRAPQGSTSLRDTPDQGGSARATESYASGLRAGSRPPLPRRLRDRATSPVDEARRTTQSAWCSMPSRVAAIFCAFSGCPARISDDGCREQDALVRPRDAALRAAAAAAGRPDRLMGFGKRDVLGRRLRGSPCLVSLMPASESAPPRPRAFQGASRDPRGQGSPSTHPARSTRRDAPTSDAPVDVPCAELGARHRQRARTRMTGSPSRTVLDSAIAVVKSPAYIEYIA